MSSIVRKKPAFEKVDQPLILEKMIEIKPGNRVEPRLRFDRSSSRECSMGLNGEEVHELS